MASGPAHVLVLGGQRSGKSRYAETLIDYNCNFAAGLHNLTTAEQRLTAARKLKDYEDEFRALAADVS